MKLADKKCVPVKEGELPLESSDIHKYLVELDGDWEAVGDAKITKTFTFQNFLEAVEFVNKVAKIAEAEDHHPDLRIYSYKKVDVELTTHAVKGLTENDFILAAKIEEIG